MRAMRTVPNRAFAFWSLAALLLTPGGRLWADQPAQEPEPMPAHAQGTTSQLPSGHPPVTTPSSPADAIPLPPPGSGTGKTGLAWDAPKGWVEEAPSSTMRRAQYRVPGAGGDGQCVVYYFGPGQGGAAMANAERWAGQFHQPDGRASSEVMKTETLEVVGIPVLVVEVTGDYGGGMAGPALKGAMLLGAIAEGPDANWFFKLTGPEVTLQEQRKAFEALYGSLRQPE